MVHTLIEVQKLSKTFPNTFHYFRAFVIIPKHKRANFCFINCVKVVGFDANPPLFLTLLPIYATTKQEYK